MGDGLGWIDNSGDQHPHNSPLRGTRPRCKAQHLPIHYRIEYLSIAHSQRDIRDGQYKPTGKRNRDGICRHNGSRQFELYSRLPTTIDCCRIHHEILAGEAAGSHPSHFDVGAGVDLAVGVGTGRYCEAALGLDGRGVQDGGQRKR